jgi:hypothetical protein
MDVVELTAGSPALVAPVCQALGLPPARGPVISPSGGVRSSFPGLANGALRLIETVAWLERRSGGGLGVVHAAELVTGPIADTSSVLVVEVS